MKSENNASLKPYNTFGIDVKASTLAEFRDENELRGLLEDPVIKDRPVLVLGGGSNILFTRDFEGVVLRNRIQGIAIINEDENFSYVRAGGGVNWHELVLFCIDKNLGGVENLSLIPGNAGAAPIQNIGAYGVELKDSFHQLDAIDIKTGKLKAFDSEACEFGYRDSIFKRALKGRMVITSVVLRLRKVPQLNISYGAIEQELQKNGVVNPGVRDVSMAVCAIRRSKLPDPAKIGNAGSFFKNPEVPESFYKNLKEKFPSLPAYDVGHGNFKLAAGWLIEQCGWKGKIVGNTGSHKDQALVLVNYGNATGTEILNLAGEIQKSVKDKFGVIIEPEVNII